ncbi:MAG TPA: hypothetical protein VLS28_11285 [Candidatus Sulfomarinibacteraceae bacterium]|nr:hypothetical protein [Candidatus Sulfomarinibacteraceae bacterium]
MALQSIAFGGVALALGGTLWWLVTSSAGATLGTLVSAALIVPVSAALLYFGWTGLRHWLAGGPPMRLYGFDALPVLFLLVTAGPGALQDLLGVAIAVIFVLPALATFLASSRGPS